MSRAPKPAGITPASRSDSQTRFASSAGTANSTPSSPVYPVPATMQSAPAHRILPTVRLFTSATSGATLATRALAVGP